tara:strand:+ start:366 stop:713 length:348 start_codon:yes stop_codon:yes gene_type:complete
MSLTGSVKWFNSKKGYGFITVVTPEVDESGKDFFVHFSNITIEGDNYKRLYPGEYVSFDLGKSSDDKVICTDVRGVFGGKLLGEHEEYRFKIYPKRDNVVAESEGVLENGGTEDA